jgi:hypothetical protein
MSRYIAAVQSVPGSEVVYGLGSTESEAMVDAAEWCDGDTSGLHAVEVTESQADLIRAGQCTWAPRSLGVQP